MFFLLAMAIIFVISLEDCHLEIVNVSDYTTLINISIFLPMNNSYLFSASKISPAINIGLHSANSNHLIESNISMNLICADSQCRESIAMNEAIEAVIHHKPTVFIGPTCDLAVAAISRQTSFWNIPIISAGALSRDFRINKKGNYNLLTRIGPANLYNLSYFLKHLFHESGFGKIKFLYVREETKDVFDLFCHIITESLVNDLQEQLPNISLTFYKMNGSENPKSLLMNQISYKFGGKCEKVTFHKLFDLFFCHLTNIGSRDVWSS